MGGAGGPVTVVPTRTSQKIRRRPSFLSERRRCPVISSCNWTHHTWSEWRWRPKHPISEHELRPYRCMSLWTSLLISSSSTWLPQSERRPQRDTGLELSGVVKLHKVHSVSTTTPVTTAVLVSDTWWRGRRRRRRPRDLLVLHMNTDHPGTLVPSGSGSYLVGLLSECLCLLPSALSASLWVRRLPSTPLFLQWAHPGGPPLLGPRQNKKLFVTTTSAN